MALVGYMGSGKTSVGRVLARKLRWEFVDLDQAIEKEAGRKIPGIFSESGEQHFRELEHRVLLDSLDHTSERVVSCGGGVIIRPDNRERLKVVATVFLQENLEVLYQRTRKPGRPLRGGGYEDFETRYNERLPHYREVAGIEIAVRNRPRHQVAEEISQWLNG
ncbi:MAG: shikimate kinase [Rubrobacteraceae bacterium]